MKHSLSQFRSLCLRFCLSPGVLILPLCEDNRCRIVFALLSGPPNESFASPVSVCEGVLMSHNVIVAHVAWLPCVHEPIVSGHDPRCSICTV